MHEADHVPVLGPLFREAAPAGTAVPESEAKGRRDEQPVHGEALVFPSLAVDRRLRELRHFPQRYLLATGER